MKRDRSIAPLLAAAVILIPVVLAGQAVPAGDVFEIAPPPEGDEEWLQRYETPLSAVALTDGFAVAWLHRYRAGDHEYPFRIEGRLLDATGRPGRAFSTPGSDWIWTPSMAPLANGGFAGAWLEEAWNTEIGEMRIQSWKPDGAPVWEEPLSVLDNDYYDEVDGSFAVDGAGRLIVAWSGGFESHEERKTWVSPMWRILMPSGEPVTAGMELARGFWSYACPSPQVLVDRTGRILVLWWESRPGISDGALWGRYFAPDGTPLRERFLVAEDVWAGWLPLRAALMPDDGFVVLWPARVKPTGETDRFLRRFRSDGTPAGPPVLAGKAGPTWPVLALDRHGNLVTLVSVEAKAAIRLFNAHLVPQGEPIVLSPPQWEMGAYGILSIGLAFRGDRFLTAWLDFRRETPPRSILGRFWEPLRDADLCLYRGLRFVCDTAGDGGRTDMGLRFGLGTVQDTPLLGDVDGDGRDDPCVYRHGLFLCDTAHDGRGADLGVLFGQLWDDRPLLGDVDGDGRDDPCVVKQYDGVLLCDVAHDGGAAELTRPLGSLAFEDRVLLGDTDGDGRDEPCIYRKGRFLCSAPGPRFRSLVSALPGLAGEVVPLLGDVNADGRDDPCLFAAGKLVCGLFEPHSRSPRTLFERSLYHQKGDVPLLGDVDAF